MIKSVNKIKPEYCDTLSWRTLKNAGHYADLNELRDSCIDAFELYADAIKGLLKEEK